MSSEQQRDSTNILHTDWPQVNIIDRLSYIELRAITDSMKKRKRESRTFIEEKMDDIKAYKRDNQMKIKLANEIIEYLRHNYGAEYQTEVNKRRPLEIIVERSEGHHFTFHVQHDSTGLLVKELVHKQTGNKVEDQFLSYNGRTIEDDHTLEQHGVSNTTVLHVQFRGASNTTVLHVQFRGATFDVFVQGLSSRYTLRNLTGATTVRTVRNLIVEKEQQRRDNIMLSCNGQALEDGRTLSSYQIGRNSTIVASIRVRGG